MKKQAHKKRNDTLAQLSSKNKENVVLEYRIHDYDRSYHGFVKLLDKLVNYPQLSLMDRLVYCAIRNYTDASSFGKTNVRNETIADRLGIGITSVSTSISKLQNLGIIKLGMNQKRNERIIELVRDFTEEQPEEVAWREMRANQEEPTEDEEDMFEW